MDSPEAQTTSSWKGDSTMMTITTTPRPALPEQNMTEEDLWVLRCNGTAAGMGHYGAIFNGSLYNLTQELAAGGLYCGHVFDGWSCWPDTPAGFSALTPCPGFIVGFDPNRWAHKDCQEDGSWFKQQSTNKHWSNYTNCVDIDSLEWMQKVTLIYKTGYLVSLVALLLSIGILLYFKSLRCSRTTLHMNLFSSFAANNLLWLLWYFLVSEDPIVIENNNAPCKILHVILHYFLVSNYSWMLCEGFYLHTLLVATFISESRLVRWLYALGWLTPVPFVLAYTLCRVMSSDVDEQEACWITESRHIWTLNVPVVLSIGLNVLFMTNIVRVVVSKLMAGPRVGSSRPSSTLLQALRATLLLVPLLGLQYLLTPFKPEKGHEWFRVHEVTLAITASFQGLCVATLFCFCNGEVIAQVRRRWQHLMFRPRANSCTATTVSVRQVRLG